MIMVHDKFIAYHGDIVHYLSVDLYSTEPPEGAARLRFLLISKGLWPLKYNLGTQLGTQRLEKVFFVYEFLF